MNCNFIPGYFAEVECFWNTAAYIFCDERASMGAVNFEAQFF